MIQILGLLGMYFDAVVVFVANSSLLFRLAVAILCKLTICSAGNTANLVHLLETCRGGFSLGFGWVPGRSIVDRLQGTKDYHIMKA